MNHRQLIFGIQTFIFVCLIQSDVFAQSLINRPQTATDNAGVLEPFKSTEVATAEMGVVRELFVKAGDWVAAETPIGRLDHEQQRAKVRSAEVDANSFGMLETARREVEFGKRRVQETTKMVVAGKGAPKELERYQLELNIANAKLQAQEEAKLISHSRLEEARLMLHERTIRAPHSGSVIEVYRDVGEYIAGNAPAIVRLVDATKLRGRFYLSDEDAQKFRKLGQAEVRLANHLVVKAEIEFISPFAIAEGHVIEMTVLIDNTDGSIRSSKCTLVLP